MTVRSSIGPYATYHMDNSDVSPREIVRRLRERAAQYAELGDIAESILTLAAPTLLSKISPNVRQEVILSDERELLVDVGLGVYLSMTPSETQAFCKEQAERISKEAEDVEQGFAQQAAEESAMRRITELTKASKPT